MNRRKFLGAAALGTGSLSLGLGCSMPPRRGAAMAGLVTDTARPVRVSAKEILEYLTKFAPQGRLTAEEGIRHGSAEFETASILVTWMATVAAIQRAVETGSRLIVSHEPLTFHNYFPKISAPDPWASDRARLKLLDDHDITVFRLHTAVDPTHVVPEFCKVIGLSPLRSRGASFSYHEETPITLRALARKVAKGIDMDHLRVTGDLDKTVSRVITMVGGMGLDRHLNYWEREAIPRKAQVIITGETNDFAQRFAIDSGVGLIETSHSACENPGLALLAREIQARFSQIPVHFFTNPVPWTTV